MYRNILFTALISLMLVNMVSAQYYGTPIYEGCTIDEPGVYYIANDIVFENIIINAKNVELRNYNYPQFVIATGYMYDENETDEPAVIIRADSVRIYNISIGASKTAVSIEAGVKGCKIEKCRISSNYTGIKMDSTDYNQIIDCEFQGNDSVSVYLNHSSNNKLLRNNFVNAAGKDGFVLKNGSDYNEISDNISDEYQEREPLLWGYGIYIDDSCTGNYGEDNILIGDKGNYGCNINGNDVNYTSTAIDDDQYSIPQEFILKQNYPNPFNPETTIEYSLPSSAHVVITIYNMRGRKIKTLVNEFQIAGKYSIQFIAQNLPSGKYFYQLNAGGNIYTKSMLLIK